MKAQDLEKEFWWRPILADFNAIDSILGNKPGSNSGLCAWWQWGQDHAAFSYELMRRAERELKLRPYPKLEEFEAYFLCDVFGDGKSRSEDVMWYRPQCDAKPLVMDGHSLPSIWKLEIPNKTLVKVFMRFIEKERTRLGIKPKLTVAETNRHPNWADCECLDRFDFLGIQEKGSDPKRKINRAREKAKKLLSLFKAKLPPERKAYPHLDYWPEIR
jgi:hypothetical protein